MGVADVREIRVVRGLRGLNGLREEWLQPDLYWEFPSRNSRRVVSGHQLQRYPCAEASSTSSDDSTSGSEESRYFTTRRAAGGSDPGSEGGRTPISNPEYSRGLWRQPEPEFEE